MAEKEDKKDKGKKGAGAYSILSLIIVPLFMILFSDIFGFSQYNWIWYTLLGLSAIPIVFTIASYMGKRKYRALMQFFENSGLTINKQPPTVVKDEPVQNGARYTVAMPCGMAMSDFEKKKEALEQHLKRKVTISFDENLIITAVKPKRTLYPYDAPEPELFKE